MKRLERAAGKRRPVADPSRHDKLPRQQPVTNTLYDWLCVKDEQVPREANEAL
jgi:hypothetical protein